ncbi:MAG: RNase adaptor protein RapZ [Candidatus Muproteobacteria bacterium RIFCSPHIGHO2_01_FULL_65_16]|uniref:RNase adaptor protein RapZ n=3 Tax=Candidatus Muproteobacteria TaxID=1817795 RepID=A0A1F6TA91_9PROT|nr:MAG: RNase adaptor protein RapZ [Candidatus Muproteobacteria bacterium RBG_16_65_31]OGI45100.1 MAG: RNase adaptor protein RapZ [Candidatus Muproteobacteria bacterium RIFCSPHIGHO2_01_FULL_65_16]OGI50743.1 MAG: RNase adaptor protein RapZ [Candidatus Muproteobacteria bacterium RIFCSPHIGHO2_02_FULL_65_16]
MSFFIVSGLSGSGKTIALQALEDIGFYCIDNLPAALLPHFAQQVINSRATGMQNAAVGIDARNRAFLAEAPKGLNQLHSLGVQYRIIFLEAEEAVLVKRFKETRRPHPMIDKDTSLLEAIRLERELLEPLSFSAALRIDTTHTTPHELRQQINNYARGTDTAGITLLFESFGYKHGTPLDADYVFDVRCLPNPYWQPELRRHSGLDEPVIRFLEQYDEVRKMLDELRAFLEQWLPSFEREDRNYMTIAIGCTGGLHRSVYLAHRLAGYFAAKGVKTQIRHRELK